MRVTLLLLSFLFTQIIFAQEKTISGIVSDESGGLPGVSIIIKGTTSGVETDFDGNFSINGKQNDVLVFSFVGKKTVEKTIGSSNKINVSMVDDENLLNEIVVTALGIKREKKSLGYATQEVKGDDLTKVNSGNIANSISGKVSGIQIRKNNNIGGSTNVVIRGTTSLSGNNQALWVVDGIPLDNSNTNTLDQTRGGNTGGYDFGNAASDINPDDIESINILKGAAASALYGERASNGVIIVTTKKGENQQGLGVSINSSVTVGVVDFDTLPVYQTQYGGGYANTFPSTQIDLGDGLHYRERTGDASWGPAYDKNLLVYRWNSFHPELSTYGKATPWIAPKNNGNSIYQNSITYNNSISLTAGNEQGNFRFSYSKQKLDQGILPNSSSGRDIFNLSSSYKLSDKTTITAGATYTKTVSKGANETGYGSGGNNFSSSLRQWTSTSVDYKDLENAYKESGKNLSWSINGPFDRRVAFHDNPYFQRDQNFSLLNRGRFFGNFNLTHEIADWVSVTGKASIDSYNQGQQERIAVGSKRQSQSAGQYSRYDKTYKESNLDLVFSFNTDVTDNIKFSGLLGGNIRRSTSSDTFSITLGGLIAPNVFAISNSVNTPDPATERVLTFGSNSAYASGTFSINDTYFLEGTVRTDRTSTLPTSNNIYTYPSATTTYIFSKHLKADWLSFGKVRVNYAETGGGTNPFNLAPGFFKLVNYGGGNVRFTNENTRKNSELKPERTKGYETGLELKLFKNRIGLDISYYKTNTTNQIMSVPSTGATGYTNAWINAGNIENKGIELSLTGTPIKNENFSWETTINWTRNRNKTISLDGSPRLTLGSFQRILSVAEVGKPVGLLVASGYDYYNGVKSDANRIVDANGDYTRVNSQIIGDINPDWTGGINNKLKYKNLILSFLVDMKKGGDVWSLDQKYGRSTGIYATTAGNNELGNPMRDPVTSGSDSGGVLLQGVFADGTKNTVRSPIEEQYGFPEEQFVYDASYIKLREVSISYSLPSKFLEKSMFKNITFSANGSNLWIIHKNLPYADPEAGTSSGNLQGFQTGVLPTTKEYSFNVKVQF
ncbi:SusC/RagA family TonB-linked outer membrane protein [Tenacibaculum sp. Bg11-29]|uniref:SusC/RagA family TonB-linked outer membrane protein n=1 Tax=Tenacibaculum sp. Bg11-29 TaxID=2058306 RepID=UPI000C31F970|nr:SusC/RagA family TonB-linked outer membrane protein [Tenacibaculum sp. Bg11-29]PKH49268.1 SusC/RagA family TonB-linked outer membrane protein [Tenacibaculum sp. Bg11-29]